MARAVTEGRKWRQAPKSTKRNGKKSFGKTLNNISRLVADVLLPALLNSCLHLSKPCARLQDQQHGVQQRLCWQTVVQRPPNVGGSCKEEEKKPKWLRLPKEERRARGKVNVFVIRGQSPLHRELCWDTGKTPHVRSPPGWNAGFSTIRTWWLWFMIWSLLRGWALFIDHLVCASVWGGLQR